MRFIPKKTVDKIVQTGNYYVLQVKRNQKKLFNAIQNVICTEVPLDFYQEVEKCHGRHPIRSVCVYHALFHPQTKNWMGLKRFIHVPRYVYETKTGKEIASNRFYSSNLSQTDASYYQQGIRGHWGIENGLHRHKDWLHREDKNRIRGENAPVNISIISTIALNLHYIGYNIKNPSQMLKHLSWHI